jgi:hypothetical protein
MIGCLSTAQVRTNGEGVQGAGVSVEGPVSKLRFGLETVYEKTADSTDAEPHGALTFDYTMRVGLVSWFRERSCPECTSMPAIDFGPGAGLGFGFRTPAGTFLGHGFVGGWFDVRLWRGETFPVLRLEFQKDAYSGPAQGEYQLVIGLGFVDDSPK